MANDKKRRSLVLLEIMVALLILGILTAGITKTARSAMEVARYRKSLDQAAQISAALDNHLVERGDSVEFVLSNWQQIARASPLVGSHHLLRDGWGYDFECHLDKSQHEMVRAAQRSNRDRLNFGPFVLISKGLHDYQKRFSPALKPTA